ALLFATLELMATLDHLAHTHEGTDHMSDRLARIALIGVATGEDDIFGHPIALGKAEDILVWLSRAHVVDAQIERRAYLEIRQHAHSRNAARGIHQRGDGTAMNHAGFRIANDLRAVGQTQRQSLWRGLMHAQAQYLAVAQGRQEIGRASCRGSE